MMSDIFKNKPKEKIINEPINELQLMIYLFKKISENLGNVIFCFKNIETEIDKIKLLNLEFELISNVDYLVLPEYVRTEAIKKFYKNEIKKLELELNKLKV
jgi:hypothetical protein